LRAIYDMPVGVFLIVPEQAGTTGQPEYMIALSENDLQRKIDERWPYAEMEDDFWSCEEPEAVEGEYKKCVYLDYDLVAKIYTVEEKVN